MRLPLPSPLPKIPGVPDPLRRINLPKDLEGATTRGPEEPPEAGGMTSEQVEKIWDAAVNLYRSGVHPALQICLRREGQIVLNRAIGHAKGNGPADSRGTEKEPATPETPFNVFSTSKGITAMVIHLLDERGDLHVADRVCDYIPGYESHGKDSITIAHVLSHRAGVAAMPKQALDLDLLNDRDFLRQTMCDTKPSSRAGRLLAYHAVSGGFILGEIVQRVTGKRIDQVLADEILDPLGFRWGNYGVKPTDISKVALNYVTGPPLLPPLSTLVTRTLSAPLDKVVEMSNDPRFLAGPIPSANVVTTADELGRFFELLRQGGELDGVRIMDARTIRRALAEQSHLEIDLSLGFPTRFSMGLMLGAKLVSLYGPDTDLAFGHLGLINIVGWADPERGLSCGLITNGKAIIYPELPRFYNVMKTIASVTPKVPVEQLAHAELSFKD